MKKILCLIAFIFFAFSGNTLNAQSLLGENMRLGLYVQPTSVWLGSQNNDIDPSGGLGFGFGLISDYHLPGNPNYIIGSGLNFQYVKGEVSMTTIGSDSTTTAVTRTGTYRTGYVEIPVTIKLSTNGDHINDFTFFGQLGVNLGLPLLRTRYDFVDPSYTPQDGLPDNEKAGDLIQRFRVGLVLSAGAEWLMTDDGDAGLFASIYISPGLTSYLRNKAFDGNDAFDFNYDNKDNKVSMGYAGLRIGAMF